MNTITSITGFRGVTATSEDLKTDTKQQTPDSSKQVSQQEKNSTPEEVKDVVVELNDLAQNSQRDLLFSVDKKSGDTIIKVLDKQTEEVVREIPSAEIRAVKERLLEAAGIIFRDSV